MSTTTAISAQDAFSDAQRRLAQLRHDYAASERGIAVALDKADSGAMIAARKRGEHLTDAIRVAEVTLARAAIRVAEEEVESADRDFATLDELADDIQHQRHLAAVALDEKTELLNRVLLERSFAEMRKQRVNQTVTTAKQRVITLLAAPDVGTREKQEERD